MATFSIIIPVFNKELFVSNTLKSVLSQTFSDFEIIVVNDGSTDDSEEIILTLQDERIRYFYKENEGVAVARNFGILQSKAAFICFLDADDYWYPTFLEVMYSYIITFPEQSVFACAIEIETLKNTFPAQYSITKKDTFEIVNFFEASQKESVLWTSSVAIKKAIFDKVGSFDISIKKGEDTELWIRIGLQFPVVFVWQVMARYVFDASSISRNNRYFFEKYVFQKYAKEEKNNPKLKKFLDSNRFSAVIKCHLNGDYKTAEEIYKDISQKNLSLKKRIILQLPSFAIKILVNFKSFLTTIRLGNSVFR